MKQTKTFECDECEYKTESREKLEKHQFNEHHSDFENKSESDDSKITWYHCDICNYDSWYPDNVAFHYREAHNIQMSWEEAEIKCKRWKLLWNWNNS